jgi:hypothetical protein
MTHKAHLFIEANRESPLVYQSSDGDKCLFRLKDGRTFELTAKDCLAIPEPPRWAHLEP